MQDVLVGETGFEPATARPQPERSRRTRCGSALYSGVSCAELSELLSTGPQIGPRAASARAGRPGAANLNLTLANTRIAIAI